jgi:predicted pyridoxine 5'-phosphate oxidase superfamily flavin-nucleotide-binding protein
MAMTPTTLSPELQSYFQGPQLVLVTTMDAETKWPTNNLISWVYAKDQATIRLAADAQGRLLNNIRADERVLLSVFTNGACYTIEGVGKVIAENIDGVSIKLGVAEISVKAVRDVTFYGGKITAEPAFEVTYDRALKEKLNIGVFNGLRSL